MPSRRRFLGMGASALVLLGTGGVWWVNRPTAADRALRFASLEEALRELDRLASALPLDPPTAFNWSQTLQHLAQSVEYAMLGYPQAKPAAFQATLGSAAFALFAWQGRMHHGLDEPIPGAPPLDATLDPDAAAQRLRQAIADFQRFGGPL
jgi:hypothetical protein